MTHPVNAIVELSPAEKKSLWRAVNERGLRLDRCRAVFDVEISAGYRAGPEGHPDMPARCRIVYQRADMETWQVTVVDENGSVVCDLASDGAWIEAKGKCWHRAFQYASREAFDEQWSISREEQERRDEIREPLEDVLNQALWPVQMATTHLFLDVPFMSISNPQAFYKRDQWEISRSQDSDQIHCRFQSDYQPMLNRFSTWEWLRWKAARLWRPGVDIEDYFQRTSSPRRHHELDINTSAGLVPERLRSRSLPIDPECSDRLELWEGPIEASGGQLVPSVYTDGTSTRTGEPHLRSTLIVEDSAFGVNIPLDIRPVDRTKERVNWLRWKEEMRAR